MIETFLYILINTHIPCLSKVPDLSLKFVSSLFYVVAKQDLDRVCLSQLNGLQLVYIL